MSAGEAERKHNNLGLWRRWILLCICKSRDIFWNLDGWSHYAIGTLSLESRKKTQMLEYELWVSWSSWGWEVRIHEWMRSPRDSTWVSEEADAGMLGTSSLRAVILNRSNFAPQRHLESLEAFLVVITEGVGRGQGCC